MSSIRCGHCKETHTSVAEVRYCHLVETQGAIFDEVSNLDSVGEYVYTEGAGPSLAEDPITGVFVGRSGVIYKVVQSPTTGNFYAKSYDKSAEEWAYVGRKPLHFLFPTDRMSAEQAAEFGHLTGQCVFCGRGLTDERSIAVGYGPTCAEREGLPWG